MCQYLQLQNLLLMSISYLLLCTWEWDTTEHVLSGERQQAVSGNDSDHSTLQYRQFIPAPGERTSTSAWLNKHPSMTSQKYIKAVMLVTHSK